MNTIFRDKQIRFEWRIRKTPGMDLEHFERANLGVFLIGGGEIRTLTLSSIAGGVLEGIIPSGLPAGVYDLKAMWTKNEAAQRPLPRPLPPQRLDDCHNWELDNRCLMVAYVDGAFAVTDVQSEETEPLNPVLKINSFVATYGYDGMSAYESAVLRGLWSGTESEYLGLPETIREHDETATANEAVRVSAETARVAAETARVAAESERESKQIMYDDAELVRVQHENDREAYESARLDAEEARGTAESFRQLNEEERVANEGARLDAETARESAEVGRVSAESARVEAEAARAAAEVTRESTYEEKLSEMEEFVEQGGFNVIQPPAGGTVGQVLTKTATGVAWDDASGGVVEETDPVFSASPAHGITANDIAIWNSAAILGEDDGEATSLDFDPQADTVWNKAQILSSAQQQQARANIGAGTVNSVAVNGTTYNPINGNVDLGTISGGGSGEANVIESISIHNTAQTITSKNVDLSVPTSSDVFTIVKTTQAAYDLITTPDSHTLYIITES